MSFRSIFADNTAFTPQSTDRHLFRNNSFCELHSLLLQLKSTNLYKVAIQPDYSNALMRYNNYDLDGHQQLSRRESYPNLVCVLH
jgi:hypothetical protein